MQLRTGQQPASYELLCPCLAQAIDCLSQVGKCLGEIAGALLLGLKHVGPPPGRGIPALLREGTLTGDTTERMRPRGFEHPDIFPGSVIGRSTESPGISRGAGTEAASPFAAPQPRGMRLLLPTSDPPGAGHSPAWTWSPFAQSCRRYGQ